MRAGVRAGGVVVLVVLALVVGLARAGGRAVVVLGQVVVNPFAGIWSTFGGGGGLTLQVVSAAKGKPAVAFYDPVTRTSVVSMLEGHVQVTPANSALPRPLLHAGQEVEVTAASETPPAPLGRAGVPVGDISRHAALALVDKVLAKNTTACGLRDQSVAANHDAMLPASHNPNFSARVRASSIVLCSRRTVCSGPLGHPRYPSPTEQPSALVETHRAPGWRGPFRAYPLG